MEGCMKTLGLAAAVALCAVLAAGTGRAQEAAPKTGSYRDALRPSAGDIGDSRDIGAASKRNDSGGDRGGSQSRPAGGDTARAGSSVRAGPGTDASRKGAAGPAGA